MSIYPPQPTKILYQLEQLITNKLQFCNKKSLEYYHNIVVIRQIKKGLGGMEDKNVPY